MGPTCVSPAAVEDLDGADSGNPGAGLPAVLLFRQTTAIRVNARPLRMAPAFSVVDLPLCQNTLQAKNAAGQNVRHLGKPAGGSGGEAESDLTHSDGFRRAIQHQVA